MQLFLIRHGETVDNVAGVWAGVRDSALTAHGVLQASRLASHLAGRVVVSAIFSSDLQRAAKTANAIREEQLSQRHLESTLNHVPHTQLVDLRERDFGPLEGVSFRGAEGVQNPDGVAESKDAMRTRADRFLDAHLFPLLHKYSPAGGNDASQRNVVVVAHGIMLSVLFKALSARICPGGLTVSPAAGRGSDTDALPFWSNTGYLECSLNCNDDASTRMHILRINCMDHMKNVRKTRGGIGSAAFDETQQTMDAFFTRAPPKK